MCGITGIAIFKGPAPSYDQLKAMCNTLIHRGPDEEGMDIREKVALGIRRLSVIDLETGIQPIFNEDRTIRTIFNGEIYNFRELRADLELKGHAFYSRSDSEILVHAYEEYGLDFPQYLNGMFAIALHDGAKRRLCLVRDHLGIKPLYYASTKKHIVWGSEIKAILASGLVDRQLDFNALGEFLSWEYIPGHSTLFKSIRKLEPANMLVIDLDNPICHPSSYWDVSLTGEEQKRTSADWEEEVDQKIKACVQRQLVSDVPLGAFLSGGVDSSLVVSAMGKAKTYSIGFDDPSYNELKWARKVAKHLGSDHIDDVIKPDIVNLFEKLMYFMDDPIGDFSIFPTYLVARHARNYVTVALSGDGGDELFGGYETYAADQIDRWYARTPTFFRYAVIEPFIKSLKPRSAKKGLVNKATRFVEGLEQPDDLFHARWRIFTRKGFRQTLFTPDVLEELTINEDTHIRKLFQKAGGRDPLNRSLYVDLKSYLCDNCLVKIDRMSMAVSLESRVPLLDKELVELAFQIPGRHKVTGGKTKVLLKQIAARHVPRECVYRSKEGFSIPIKNWLKSELRPLMEELLSNKTIRDGGIFQTAAIENLKQEHIRGTANHSHLLWSLMVFQSWKKMWLNH